MAKLGFNKRIGKAVQGVLRDVLAEMVESNIVALRRENPGRYDDGFRTEELRDFALMAACTLLKRSLLESCGKR
jgi:hypothetical protein